MSPIPDLTRRDAGAHPEPHARDELCVVIAGRAGAVAELWRGSALLGILRQEHGGIVLRLESHARGPLTLSAVALERALAEARERLTARAPARVPTRDSTRDSS
jgi:hypothetical protein